MSDKDKNGNPLNVRAGWYSEPNVEMVVQHDDVDRGILETIKDFFKLMFF